MKKSNSFFISQIRSWKTRDKLVAAVILVIFLTVASFFSFRSDKALRSQSSSPSMSFSQTPPQTQSQPPQTSQETALQPSQTPIVQQQTLPQASQFPVQSTTITIPETTLSATATTTTPTQTLAQTFPPIPITTQPPPPPSPFTPDGKVILVWNPPQGLKCRTSHSGIMRLKLNNRVQVYGQEKTSPEQHEASWKKRYIDIYNFVQGGRPRQITRFTEEDSITALDPLSGQLIPKDRPTRGTTVTLAIRDDGSVEVTNPDALAQVVDIFKKLYIVSLLPGRSVAMGEEWTLIPGQLRTFGPEVTAGYGKLKLIKTELDPTINQYISYISGDLVIDYAIPYQDPYQPGQVLPIRLEAKLTMRYVPAYGVEILRNIEGNLSVNISYTVGDMKRFLAGTGEYREVTSVEIIR